VAETTVRKTSVLRVYDFIYLLLTAIGLMPGGSVYKDPTFNKETAQYIARFSQLIQVHEHSETQQNIQKKTGCIYCPERNPGRQAYSSSLHSLSYPDTGKTRGHVRVYQCWWKICSDIFFSKVKSHMFYVLYRFVTYLLTLVHTFI
jgi:hypothetical protein